MKSLFLIALLVFGAIIGLAQTPPSGTVVSNQATVKYSDTAGNNHTQTSNTVTFNIASVGGLAITPDAQAATNLVPGATQVLTFTVTNTSNYSESVIFPASGAGATLTGSATITRAVIDANSNGSIDPGDTDILTNATAVTNAATAANSSFPVLVEVQVNTAAAIGSTVTINLGDAASNAPSYDNVASDSSGNEVRTVTATAVNGLREAKGSYTFSVIRDAEITVNLAGTNGPVAPADTITYTTSACNLNGTQSVASISLNGSPASVYIVGLIPTNTTLKAGQTFVAGTLYSTDAHTILPTAATWTTVQPPLATIQRIAFPTGATLAPTACTSSYIYDVVVSPTVTATTVLVNIADVFGTNSQGNTITDQSGDATPSQGSGNGGTVPIGGTAGVSGIPLVTPVSVTAGVLNGTYTHADATGPTGNNDDYTNKGGFLGITGVLAGGVSTAANTLVFDNTLQNIGDINDSFTLTTPTVPSGTTVQISLDGGTTWVTTSGGGSVVTASLAPTATADYKVRVTIPSGAPAFTGLSTTVTATSVADPTKTNNTIDRVYVGFITLSKSQAVVNNTGKGSPVDAVPGAVIEYTITYTNVASTGGTNSYTLNATNFVIIDDGGAAPNNWETHTYYQSGEVDSQGAAIVVSNSTNGVTQARYTSTLATLPAGASGTLLLKRIIK